MWLTNSYAVVLFKYFFLSFLPSNLKEEAFLPSEVFIRVALERNVVAKKSSTCSRLTGPSGASLSRDVETSVVTFKKKCDCHASDVC